MRASADTPRWASALACTCLLFAASCKASGEARAPQMQTKTAEAGYAPPPPGQELAELDRLEQQMRALNLPVAESAASKGKSAPVGGEAGSPPADLGGEVADDVADAEPAEEAEAEVVASEEAPRPTARDEGGDRCTNVCDLSAAICTLEDRICSLSESHGQDPVYVDACERAVEDCDVASDACQRCEG